MDRAAFISRVFISLLSRIMFQYFNSLVITVKVDAVTVRAFDMNSKAPFVFFFVFFIPRH